MVYIPETFISEYKPAGKHSLLSSDGWWLNRWPLLGWLETFVKIGAWCFVPLIPVKSATPITFTKAPSVFFAQAFLMGIAAALLGAAIIDRLFYREITSMIFVFPNNWAHWTVLSAMYRLGRDGINGRYMRIFCWLMLAGDVIKLIFFVVHDFSISLVAKYVVYLLVTLFAVFYALILLLDYGYLEAEAVQLHTFYTTRMHRLFVAS